MLKPHLPKLTLLFLGSILLPSALSSNDTTATIAGGVITYNLTDDVSMDSELLKVGIDDITIEYTFTNHSKKDVDAQVAFPLPPSPVTLFDHTRAWPEWDETYHAYRYVEEINAEKPDNGVQPLRQSVDHTAFTNFKRTVNGESYGSHMMVKAIDKNGKDITDTLRQNKVPLSALYLGGFMDEPALERDPDLKKKLSDLNLLNDKGQPIWQTHIIYHWQQKFPVEKSINVAHSYKPYTGLHWMIFKGDKSCVASLDDIHIDHRDVDATGKPENKKLTDYTISDDDKDAILKMFNDETAKKNGAYLNEKSITYRVKEVRYVLSTGANWKGPIKSFRLEIVPPTKDSIILVDFDGKIEKTKEGYYTCEIKDFKPLKDLKVLFIDKKNWN